MRSKSPAAEKTLLSFFRDSFADSRCTKYGSFAQPFFKPPPSPRCIQRFWPRHCTIVATRRVETLSLVNQSLTSQTFFDCLTIQNILVLGPVNELSTSQTCQLTGQPLSLHPTSDGHGRRAGGATTATESERESACKLDKKRDKKQMRKVD